MVSRSRTALLLFATSRRNPHKTAHTPVFNSLEHHAAQRNQPTGTLLSPPSTVSPRRVVAVSPRPPRHKSISFSADVPICHASQGNNYSTPGGNNSREGSSYNYQHSNGSYYYANDNGSTYYKSSSGSSTYTSPSGNVTKK